MANGTAKITRTFGTPTDRDKWTLSAWVKLDVVQEQGLFWGWNDASNYTNIEFGTTGKLTLYNHESGSAAGKLTTNRLFRDFSAWYHIVVVWDSGNATAGDRIIFYTNGVRETSFSVENNPAQDTNSTINGSYLHELGAKYGSYDISGCMSHVQFVDGSALAPTEFGEFDSTSGIWKIKTGAYATPGNNGFFLKMEDRTNLDLDSSSNAHTFSTTGTLTATYDNPSNNFCTGNPLDNYFNQCTYTNGNTTWTTNSGTHSSGISTLAVDSGKWYVEGKLTTNAGNIGITDRSQASTSAELGQDAYSLVYQYGGTYRKDGSSGAYGNSYTAGDIIGIALDLDNNKIYFSKNGTWQNSGVPTSGATGTGALSVTDPASTNSGVYHIAAGDWNSGASIVWGMNFGNGYFGTTAVSSANADDAGIGAFEYDVPTGYYALCTKNIKAYGG